MKTSKRDDFPRREIKKLKQEEPPRPIVANFGLSGVLASDKKTGNVVALTDKGEKVITSYSQPPDACEPQGDWRIFVFKGDDDVNTLYLHRKSFFIFGRDENLSDVLLDHPSCSKEHAALQYRKRNGVVKLYIIDLESTSGTYLNNDKISPARYVEIKDGDVIKFGDESAIDYVFKQPSSKKEKH